MGLKIINWNFSASCLEHSLQTNPKDIEITKGEVIETIKKDINFKTKIAEVVKNYKNKQTLNIKDSVIFNTSDLYNSLHEVTLIIKGKKYKTKWNLDITITDKYDFTELIKIQDYMGEDRENISKIFSATGNNLAMIATSCNVVHTYNITIKFSMEI